MPIRFGVTLAPDLSPAVWRDKVRAFEDSPVDVLLVNDHLTGLRYAPMVALAAAAEHSTRLRLGTVVLANDYRHPAILAKEAATLDLLSEGRLELGIGAGWMLLQVGHQSILSKQALGMLWVVAGPPEPRRYG